MTTFPVMYSQYDVVDLQVAAHDTSANPVYAVPLTTLPRRGHWLAESLYRGFEVVVAATTLILLLPVIFVEAIIIKLDSPGPAIFRQLRTSRSKLMYGREL